METLRRDGGRYGARLVPESGGEAIELVGRFKTRPVMRSLTDVGMRLGAMDEAGVRVQAISNWMDLSAYEMDAGLGARFVGLQNDCIANIVQQHPDRFVGLCSVPLQDGERAAAELRRCMERGEFRGCEIGTNVDGINLDDAALDPFWDAAEATGAFVFMHPFNTLDMVTPRLQRYFFSNLIGNPLDTCIAAASMIFGGVLERYPNLKVCLAHGGGHLPYQVGRLQHGFTDERSSAARTKAPPIEQYLCFYYDTITHSRASLEFLVSLVGAEHVMLGSDYPFYMGDPRPVETVEGCDGLTREQKDLILSGNARRLIGV
jgi:aminocarboxymuconate-semialdehyde decarboxylase